MTTSLTPAVAVLRNPDFRQLWLSGFFGSLSRWFELLAVALFVYELTGSPTKIAVVAAARMAPMLVLGFYVGVLSDRTDRRRLLLFMYGAMTLAPLALAIALILGEPPFGAIVVTALVSGLGFSGELPVRRRLIANSVEPEHLVRASAIDNTTVNIARLVGLLVSGIAFAGLGGAGIYFTVAALAFAAWLLLFVARSGVAKSGVSRSGISPTNVAPATRQSLLPPAELMRNRRLWAVFGVAVIFNFTAFPFVNLLPVFADSQLGASAGLVGVIAAAEGLGATIGTLAVIWLATPATAFRWHYLGVAGCLSCMLALSFVETFALAVTGAFCLGASAVCFLSTQYPIVHVLAPPGMRGRALGLLSTFIGVTVIGSLNLGFMFDKFGVPLGMQLTVLEMSVPLLAVALLWWRAATPTSGAAGPPE